MPGWAEINIVTASSNALQNLLRCVHKSGLQEEELVPAPLVCGGGAFTR